ncbi:MAG: hypothetical protein MUF07_11830 [Steroidobacteraceae bacterium]|jgi:hypothetical protein|nr:hypothetical protein [Steroidobacteraceae bacterium]
MPRPHICFLQAQCLPWHEAGPGLERKRLGDDGSPALAATTDATEPLRLDPRTGEQSFLYCAMPQHPPPAVMVGRFTHPVIEEIFVLEGSYVFGDVGRMGPGGYVYWREDVWHGPAGSETGYHLFIRVVGGVLRNVFSPEPASFDWNPPYRPVLPEALRPLAREHSPGPRW